MTKYIGSISLTRGKIGYLQLFNLQNMETKKLIAMNCYLNLNYGELVKEKYNIHKKNCDNYDPIIKFESIKEFDKMNQKYINEAKEIEVLDLDSKVAKEYFTNLN